MRISKVLIFVICALLTGAALADRSTCGEFPTSQFGFGYSCSQSAPSAPEADAPAYSPGHAVSGLEAEIVRQVNLERAKHGLSPLTVSPELSRAAYIRAEETTRQFSHNRPDGSKWSTVSEAAKGENIARGHRTADKVMAAWLTSDGHRANILRQSFTTIGICAYEHNGIMYWVQLFGVN